MNDKNTKNQYAFQKLELLEKDGAVHGGRGVAQQDSDADDGVHLSEDALNYVFAALSKENGRIWFSVDDDLKISDASVEFQSKFGLGLSEMKGVSCYTMLPRLAENGPSIAKEVVRAGTVKRLSGNTKPEGQIDGGWFIMAAPHEGYEQIPKGIKIYLFPLSQLFQLLQTGQDYDNILSVNHYIEAYAHSIRNPLNSLKGAVHYLKQKFKDLEGADSFIQIAEEEIKRLDDLTLNFIQNLLEHPHTTQTDINSIIAKFQTILSFKLKDDQVRFSVDYGDIPTVLINPFELEQAISNILNNAIKAVSSGGTIKLETFTRELENRRYAVIKVTDSGCGFEPSSSDSSLVQAESTGSGFGLKITRRILRRYGGRLDIKSQPNRGTTAALLLPVS